MKNNSSLKKFLATASTVAFIAGGASSAYGVDTIVDITAANGAGPNHISNVHLAAGASAAPQDMGGGRTATFSNVAAIDPVLAADKYILTATAAITKATTVEMNEAMRARVVANNANAAVDLVSVQLTDAAHDADEHQIGDVTHPLNVTRAGNTALINTVFKDSYIKTLSLKDNDAFAFSGTSGIKTLDFGNLTVDVTLTTGKLAVLENGVLASTTNDNKGTIALGVGHLGIFAEGTGNKMGKLGDQTGKALAAVDL